MPRIETRKVVLWADGVQTEKAYRFYTFDQRDPKHREVWVPRSVIHHVSRDPCHPGDWQRCTVELEEWFADKNEF